MSDSTSTAAHARFPAVRLPFLEGTPLPPVQRARLTHPSREAVRDPQGAVRDALDTARASGRLAALAPGARVAIAIGSRGIAGIAAVARTTASWLRDAGMEPFIVPAMGTHGGGTADGQVAVLERLGITEDSIGAPVRATMDTVDYGLVDAGVPCRFDANAAAADAVIILARVKSHTSFDRPIESGLTKMMAVGLGKAAGARNVHLLGARGYTEVLPQLATRAIERSPVALGLAVVENSAKELVVIEGVEPEQFLAADARLLGEAKALLARLPFERIDMLVVERLGKEISGAGMDYAIMGRTDIRGVPNPDTPFVTKLVALGLTEATAGNGLGIGVADFTTKAAADSLDLYAMYFNSATSTMVEKVRIPVVLADDEMAIRAAAGTSWRTDPENARYCQIRSTLELTEILASPSLLADVADDPRIEVLGEPSALEFDAGALVTRV